MTVTPDPLAAVKTAAMPWLVWIKVGVAVALFLLVFGSGWKVCDWRWQSKENREKKELIDKIERERADWDAERKRWELASEITAGNIAALESQKDALVATISGMKLTKTVVVKPNEKGECESAVLDDSFRLRWNAVVQQAAVSPTADRGH